MLEFELNSERNPKNRGSSKIKVGSKIKFGFHVGFIPVYSTLLKTLMSCHDFPVGCVFTLRGGGGFHRLYAVTLLPIDFLLVQNYQVGEGQLILVRTHTKL